MGEEFLTEGPLGGWGGVFNRRTPGGRGGVFLQKDSLGVSACLVV